LPDAVLDLKSLVPETTNAKKGNTVPDHRLGPYADNSAEWKDIIKMFGTSSPSRMSKILSNLAALIVSGKVRIVAVEAGKGK